MKKCKKNIKKNELLTKISMIIAAISISFNTSVYASSNLTVPDYVRIRLYNHDRKETIELSNNALEIGYDEADFDLEAEIISGNGFKFQCDMSKRLISNNSYKSYKEVLDIIGEDTTLLPALVSNDDWRISTKPNITETNIESMREFTENSNAIVLMDGGYKEKILFTGNDIPLLKSGEDEETETLKFSDRFYRGYIKLKPILNGNDKLLNTVNYVKMDEYLYSVLASEMSVSWPIEALKAQAITARTFATKKYYAERYEYYDLVNTTDDQVYKGFKVEGESTIKAADETSGMVLIYDDKLVETYYYSTSGGVTEEPQNVWYSEVPYLKSKKDIYEKENSHYGWKINFTIDDLENATNNVPGLNIGLVTGARVEKAKESGRVLHFILEGKKGEYTVSKDKIRSFFTNYMDMPVLKSTNFELYSKDYTSETETEEVKNTVMILGANGELEEKEINNLYIVNREDDTTYFDENSIYAEGDNGKVIIKEEIVKVENKTYTNPYNLSSGEYLIIGDGWGHGVGMSQSGAKGMAEEGFDCAEILTFYYTDTEIYK